MDSRDEKPLFTRGRSLRFRPKSRVLTNSDSENESGMIFAILHFLKNSSSIINANFSSKHSKSDFYHFNF